MTTSDEKKNMLEWKKTQKKYLDALSIHFTPEEISALKVKGNGAKKKRFHIICDMVDALDGEDVEIALNKALGR